MRAVADRDGDQPFITADAVILMHHQIAGAERGQFGKEGIGGFAAFCGGGPTGRPAYPVR